jgi:hypothetical protein
MAPPSATYATATEANTAEIAGLKVEMGKMRKDMAILGQEQVKLLHTIQTLLSRWQYDGLPPTTTSA